MNSDSQHDNKHTKLDYRASGVDIEAGDELVEKIKPFAKLTNRSGTLGNLGGFGALFDLKATGYEDPILVSSTDGVGTKLKIAIETGIHNTVGIDLVAMCVNDLVVQGAEPLFFLDYFATGSLDVNHASEVIKGITDGCAISNCALIGGETAEMPGLYRSGDYDLAGFAVGAVERNMILPRNVAPGDVIIGLPSTGIHSNGFSLVRKIMEQNNLDWRQPVPWNPKHSLGEFLLQPTKIYVNSMLALHKAGLINAAAHITGGGLVGNLPRVLPVGVSAVIDSPWIMPEVFSWLAHIGGISSAEMFRVFNCGIGMVLIVSPRNIDRVYTVLQERGEEYHIMGYLQPHHSYTPVVDIIFSQIFSTP